MGYFVAVWLPAEVVPGINQHVAIFFNWLVGYSLQVLVEGEHSGAHRQQATEYDGRENGKVEIGYEDAEQRYNGRVDRRLNPPDAGECNDNDATRD